MPAPKYEQQMRVTCQNGGDQVLARKGALQNSETQRMVADEVYDDMVTVDLSEEDLTSAI